MILKPIKLPFPQYNWNFKSTLSLIVRVNVVLNRTAVVDSDWRFDNLCGSHLQSQSELYHVSWWYYTLVIDLTVIILECNMYTLNSTIHFEFDNNLISNFCCSIHTFLTLTWMMVGKHLLDLQAPGFVNKKTLGKFSKL